MINNNKILLDKTDEFRALLTDTAPGDTPIIFSNDGMYQNIINSKESAADFRNDILNNILFDSKQYGYTKPYIYKINHQNNNLRSISLIHPFNQLKYTEFYKNFSDFIIHLCSKSKCSLRSPYKIGSSFTLGRDPEPLNKYRKININTQSDDIKNKYSTSYFSYKGVDKVYKFYKSSEFLNFEKKYSIMSSLDVSKCFDTIYTHSICWAVKSKHFSKTHTSNFSFANEFDNLIQKSNYNETNGIPIGSEVSRIFAEIIFVKIDEQIIQTLQNENLHLNIHYVFKRYVDDYFIFANSDEDLLMVESIIKDNLREYNLNINESKSHKYHRPFLTKRSAAMLKVNSVLESFFSSITESESFDEKQIIYPKPKIILHRSSQKYIEEFKAICIDYGLSYSDISSYILSALLKRIQLLIEALPYAKKLKKEMDYKYAFLVLLEVSFFFFTVAPTVTYSYTISKIIILSSRFFKLDFEEDHDTINQFVYEKCIRLLSSSDIQIPNHINNHISLEKVNILLAMTELGDDYLLPNQYIMDHFMKSDKVDYFEIISILYYIKNHCQYNPIKKRLYQIIKTKLSKIETVNFESNIAHLLLDLASCPYLNQKFRQTYLKRYRYKNNLLLLNEQQKKLESDYYLENPWFVNWIKIDLYNAIEKKELNSSY